MGIRDEIAELVDRAVRAAQADGVLPPVSLDRPVVERPARPEHGDYASSLPLRLARAVRLAPLALAEAIASRMPPHPAVGAVSVAPPGFVNIRLSDAWLAEQVNTVVARGNDFAASDLGGGRKVQVEFVSANPTGPLHIGNGRWASIGDSLARVLAAAGYRVEKEYLVNDQLTQVDTFVKTLLARYKQLFGHSVELPPEGYPGEYVIELARQAREQFGDKFLAEEEPPAELRAFGVE
ncbi:MAG TPA: arginine--tRNA ligase, partial [Dehalococcoidia bacterium]|nr:arginine--tRNA ligase [Dehalococcoidia bacterium]